MQQDTKEIKELLEILDRKRDKIQKSSPLSQATPDARRYINRTNKHKRPKRMPVVKQQRVHEFLQAKDFKPGDNYIEAFILFHYFKEWLSTKKVQRKFAYKGFCEMLKTVLTYKSTKRNRLLFGLNKDIREDYLTPQKEAAIRRWNLDENKKKRQSKKRESNKTFQE